MNDIIAAAASWIPPFFFHYIIVAVCVIFIMSVAVMKFKYLYWYNQPLTFRFTLRRFASGDRGGRRQASSIMNPLSLSNLCYTAVVYPFLNYVNHANVKVVDASDDTETAAATAAIHHFERIAALLSRPEPEIMAPGRIRENMYMEWGCISSDTLRIILSQATFGLSPFIGSLHRPHDVSADAADAAAAIKGVAVVTPRIMMSFDGGSQTSPVHSVSIYMCEYLAWERYTTSERESLELLETTEYIQKSREIAGEQTLYRYCEIPWFVIPFTTVYTYTFHMPLNAAAMPHLGNGMSVVRVSSANMALFYSFVNECSRDFRCCIFNEFTQLQSLVTHGIYRIYLLLFNQVRVAAAYIFAPSWMTAAKHSSSSSSSSSSSMRRKTGKNSTKANRISDLHEHISKTSTALVKYIPPVRTPQYDAFGKRVSRETAAAAAGGSAPGQQNSDDSILLLISSIQHRSLCDKGDFVNGFYSAATAAAAAAASTGVSTLHAKTTPCLVMIDTLAHNYRLIDDITKSASTATTTTGAYQLLAQDKWYYILYNAIIHEETVCKDILMI
jgi:hypothetical protein